MNQIESNGKSVDEAIFKGLERMQLSIDEVTIEVLEEGSKGIFGIGGKHALVRLTAVDENEAARFVSEPVKDKDSAAKPAKPDFKAEPKPETVEAAPVEGACDNEEIGNFLSTLFERMRLNVNTDIRQNQKNVNINLSGPKMGTLIGYRGETLDALQYITSLVVNKNSEEFLRITVDTENYRKKREETLIRLANKLASKAQHTGRKVVLEPMNPYERRILHSALQSNSYVFTQSEGDEPNRRVVISPKKN